jgi:hypothetical protein
VIDAGLNKTFKDFLRDEYDRWHETADILDTPDRTDVAVRIKNSFDGLKQSTIQNTWRKVGVPQVGNIVPDDDDDHSKEDEDDDDPGDVII